MNPRAINCECGSIRIEGSEAPCPNPTCKMSNAKPDVVDEDTLATHHLRELLRIHLCNAGPYGDIMNALLGSFTDPTTHDARRRCVELWIIHAANQAETQERMRRIKEGDSTLHRILKQRGGG